MSTDIYLVRHGEALPDANDAARPLSPRGRADVERVAELAAELGFGPAEIRHSGLVRARQTAEILARRLGPARGVHAVSGLGPEDDPEPAAVECEQAREPLMLVGHMPYMGRLAGRLLIGNPGRQLIRFGTATVAALVRTDGGVLVECVIRPSTEERP
jgi:phosphohistidine phosphatase